MSDQESDGLDLYMLMKQSKTEAASKYVGMTLEAAQAVAKVLRIGSEDGKPYMLDMEHVFGRVTVSLEDGIVTSCTIE